MARDLTRHVALHDDATSDQHGIDVAGKKERLKTHYAPEPATVVRAGSSIIDGQFKSPVKGWSFRMKFGEARKAADAAEYTREVLRMSRDRAKFRRVRLRDGKERNDTGRFKAGAVSLVTTLPPWAVGVVSRISQHELEDLLLRLAEAQAQRIEETSGRPTFGGGCHLDTAIPHFHLHVPKTDADGNVYPKATFLTGGPWLTGAVRIDRKFPEILTATKRDMMQRNLARKRRENLIDVQTTEALDAALERWIRERGLWADYEADCREYVKRKDREQKREPVRRIVQASLGHYHRTGIWPMCYQAMSLTAWHLVPRELRLGIILSIRLVQVVRKPTVNNCLKIARLTARLAEPAPITLPPLR
jgi:hypothetical protein